MKLSLVAGVAVAGISLTATIATAVHAQQFAGQNIQMVITTTPGDTQDLSGRAIGAELAKFVKMPVIPLNRVGASGSVGADYVVRAKKDGNTLLYINSSLIYAYAANPEGITYNPFKDLDPLCLAFSVPLLIAVQAESPWKSFQELIAYVKQNPGKIRGSSTGVGSVGHFGYEIIRAETGANIEMIPYSGAAPGMTALLGGHVEVAIPSPTLVLPQLKGGKVRVLLTSKKSPDFAQIPTLQDLGFKRDISSVWYGLFLPVGVPAAVRQPLVSALEKSIKSPEIAVAFQNLGGVADYRSAEEFTKMMRDEYEVIRRLPKAVPSPN